MDYLNTLPQKIFDYSQISFHEEKTITIPYNEKILYLSTILFILASLLIPLFIKGISTLLFFIVNKCLCCRSTSTTTNKVAPAIGTISEDGGTPPPPPYPVQQPAYNPDVINPFRHQRSSSSPVSHHKLIQDCDADGIGSKKLQQQLHSKKSCRTVCLFPFYVLYRIVKFFVSMAIEGFYWFGSKVIGIGLLGLVLYWITSTMLHSMIPSNPNMTTTTPFMDEVTYSPRSVQIPIDWIYRWIPKTNILAPFF